MFFEGEHCGIRVHPKSTLDIASNPRIVLNMISKEQRIEAMKGVLASLFASQRTLKSLAPQFKWAGLGNLLGDYGEFIATEVYGLQQASRGANGYDAVAPDGKKVQVKANFAASQIGFRGEADMLLCLKIDLTGDWTEIYYGDFALVRSVARYSARDNKHMVAISALQKIAKAGYVVNGPLPAATEALGTDEPI
ncbi:hypothetical protein TSA1_26610 [Bradyrhizobium nitroreducens]|uniref:DUF6998 domain-containing protein n=1 Tax=Bradyrhizobium nitroreducens TaxID=709803 RepID=A0A2M6UH75_9BRAD|nr:MULTISPECIES: hypothetical protein [Bradyrhizobium]MBJ7402179.1 hypothetical protein [Bradyrhizobium sp.]MBR0926314.1 hypothetical protein [Bradyrhizobium diazoefficiens]PIT03943.1 hypothetical protein TSA1_26610 [Bradyrhizobium nitroreducens]